MNRTSRVAHAQRKVFEAEQNHPEHAYMHRMWFQDLYDSEDRPLDFTPEARRDLR